MALFESIEIINPHKVPIQKELEQPWPFFKVFGFTLFVMLAPIRALITAVTAMAPAARSDAKPSWM